ncbi:MAG: hypothetical protein E6J45_05830 [Chloroflexi bacterium]|nr:MAG: hypothetical protein E6J45_05830 [Chloroflexota bacterium]
MRLSTDERRDEARALDTIIAAVAAGMTVFDTAHAYGRNEVELGHNERMLAGALRTCGAQDRARIVTKGGMTRTGGAWVPDGRAKTIIADCEASLAALDGLAIDLYVLHAPDPRTPWRTSVRTLARLLDEGMVRSIGVSNVNRSQIDEAVEVAGISAVENALSVRDDRAIRGGVVDRCAELGIAFIAHSPLGGARRAADLARHEVLSRIAAAHDVTAGAVALAWLLALAPHVIAVAGARHPGTARSAAAAAALRLTVADHAALGRAFGKPRPARPARRPALQQGSDVVLIMGIPGAGKSRHAEEYVARGYVRLNRDERGGSLREIARALDEQLAAGVRRIVLDNTYLTRAARSHVVDTADRRAVPVQCTWLDTPLAQAQVNLVERMLERVGSLPGPDELRALVRREPGLLTPTAQMRTLRELEPPATDEGFTALQHVRFERTLSSRLTKAGVFVAASALNRPDLGRALAASDPTVPHLIFDWRPGGAAGDLADAAAHLGTVVSGAIACAVCPHGGGPPRCWCRPPLPGLPLEFSRGHGIDIARSTLIGATPAHRTLAGALGAVYVGV